MFQLKYIIHQRPLSPPRDTSLKGLLDLEFKLICTVAALLRSIRVYLIMEKSLISLGFSDMIQKIYTVLYILISSKDLSFSRVNFHTQMRRGNCVLFSILFLDVFRHKMCISRPFIYGIFRIFRY